MVDFGSKLKELRKQSGMTQKELADKMGLTKSVISYYELQERSPSPEALLKLSAIFHVTTDYLLGVESLHKRVLDVSDLDDSDISFLEHTANYLRQKNIKKKGDNQR